MTIWRYRAVPIDATLPRELRRGEIAAETAEEVSRSLRRVGLQVIGLERPPRLSEYLRRIDHWRRAARLLMPSIHTHGRARRAPRVSELYDGLATMLQSGIPLLEAVHTIRTSAQERRRRSALRALLTELYEDLRGGRSLAESMEQFPGWFDPIEVALVCAGQESGDLAGTLRRLADGRARSDALTHRFASALVYPLVVTLVGLGVVVFLSVKTLPDLVSILEQSKIQVPALTEAVMAFGGFLAHSWWWLGLSALMAIVAIPLIIRTIATRWNGDSRTVDRFLGRLTPMVIRRLTVAGLAERLCELSRAGIPFVQSLRIVTPTVKQMRLRRSLESIVERVEQGDELASAFDQPEWFEAEFRRLLDVGQATGELDQLLKRIADRYRRQSERLIDRIAALLEPATILLLAALIGTVVMAAILPLVRLQEVIR